MMPVWCLVSGGWWLAFVCRLLVGSLSGVCEKSRIGLIVRLRLPDT
jgi:hypothetical protein